MRVLVGLAIVVMTLLPLDRKPRGIWSTLAHQRRQRVLAGEARRGEIWLPRILRAGFVALGVLYATGALT